MCYIYETWCEDRESVGDGFAKDCSLDDAKICVEALA